MTEVTEPEAGTGTAEAFPLARTCPFAPPAKYGELRETEPISQVPLINGRTAWVVTRHEQIRAVLGDTRFSSDRRNPGFPLMLVGGNKVFDEKFTPSLIAMDQPAHGRARRQVLGEFTVRRTRSLQPRIQQIVDEHLDAMLAGPKPADLVRDFALPVPSLVICELLGVPYTDHDFFQARSVALLDRTLEPAQRQGALVDLREYFDALVTTREAEPTDDLIGRQIVKRRQEGDYEHYELVSLAALLLVAGHETSANMISLGTLALLENPEQLAAIRADPARTPDAVEELLRYFTIAESTAARVATADVEIDGVLIREGEGVLGLSNAANRDPRTFTEPDTLDLARGDRHHLAFGYGPHQCIGQNLARTELQIVFDTLFRRIPGLRLSTTVEELPFKEHSSIYGLHELPVTW